MDGCVANGCYVDGCLVDDYIADRYFTNECLMSGYFYRWMFGESNFYGRTYVNGCGCLVDGCEWTLC